MSVEMNIVYEGNLRCRATHGPSRVELVTDAPVDNHGKGESFSPTDLVGTALGACILTTMAIVAERNQLDLVGTKVRVIKEMVTQPVRRIGELRVTLVVPAEKAGKLSATDRDKLTHAAEHCPVHRSLHPDVAAPIEIHWG